MTRIYRILAATVVASALIAITAVSQRIAYDLTGKWAFTVVTENGTGTPAVTLKQAGETLTGTYVSGRMGQRDLAGSVRKDTIDFVLKGGDLELRFVGKIVDNDNFSGVLDMAGNGEATFSAKREKK